MVHSVSAHILLAVGSYMAKPQAHDVGKYILNHFKQECGLPQKEFWIHSYTNPLLVRVLRYSLQFVDDIQVVFI